MDAVPDEEHAERRYRLLAEQLPGVAYIESLRSATAMWISPRIERLTGYSPEDWVADPNFFERCLHPDDRDRVIGAFDQARERLESVVCEYRLVPADGGVGWGKDEAPPA